MAATTQGPAEQAKGNNVTETGKSNDRVAPRLVKPPPGRRMAAPFRRATMSVTDLGWRVECWEGERLVETVYGEDKAGAKFLAESWALAGL